MVSRRNLGLQTTIRDEQVLTATTTDALSATDLRQAPGPGAVAVWAASDVSDSTITVRIGGKQLASAINIMNKGTGAPILTEQEAPVAMQVVRGGENIRIDVTEVSAANIRVLTAWSGQTL